MPEQGELRARVRRAVQLDRPVTVERGVPNAVDQGVYCAGAEVVLRPFILP